MKTLKCLGAAGLVLAAGAVHAVTIAGLVNTGAGLLPGAIDTRYVFTVNTPGTAVGTPCVSGTCGVVTSNSSFPILPGLWLANDATSSWLTPSATQGQSYDTGGTNGIYDWTLSFNLTGFVPSTASFSARFLADNAGVVLLNGTPIGASGPGAFNNWASFSAASGFIAGVNTLTFRMTNIAQTVGANPTGVRVEFLTSNVSAVPEPSAVLMTLAGLAMVGGLAKRRLAAQA